MENNRLKVVMFDFDGTLRTNLPRGVDAFHEYAERLGVRSSEEQRRDAWRWTYSYWSGPPEARTEPLGEQNAEQGEEFWVMNARLHLQQLGVSAQTAPQLARQIVALFNREYSPQNVLLPGVPEMLRQLSELGYQMAVVSNRDEPFADELATLGIDWAFQFLLAAGEVDIWKPDPRILLHAADQIGVCPEQVAYIGDNPYADVAAAQAAGMAALLIDPDGLFDEPGVPVIRSYGELLPILETIHVPG